MKVQTINNNITNQNFRATARYSGVRGLKSAYCPAFDNIDGNARTERWDKIVEAFNKTESGKNDDLFLDIHDGFKGEQDNFFISARKGKETSITLNMPEAAYYRLMELPDNEIIERLKGIAKLPLECKLDEKALKLAEEFKKAAKLEGELLDKFNDLVHLQSVKNLGKSLFENDKVLRGTRIYL